MEEQRKNNFNEIMRERSLSMAVQFNNLFQSKKINQVNRSVVNQVIRSSSSVAANFRAATRARSDAEFYSKICIVTEECDETQFWLDYLIRVKLITHEELQDSRNEVGELLKIFTSIKKKMKDRTTKSK
jgi:four helix bundle protein